MASPYRKNIIGKVKDGAAVVEKIDVDYYNVLCACGNWFEKDHKTLLHKLNNHKERLHCNPCYIKKQAEHGARSSTVYKKLA